MRDYVKIFTTCTFDPALEPGAPRFLYFAKSPDEAALQNQNFWGGTPFSLEFNDFRWYGRDWEAIRVEMNSFYAVQANYGLFRDGSQTLYEPKSGQLDIFRSSPRQIGYNSIVERRKRR